MEGGRHRGIFTAAVLEALQKAPPNRLGRVTGTAIKNYVHTVMGKFAGTVAVSPPTIDARPDKDVLFTERRTTPGQTVAFQTVPERVGQELVLSDGGLEEVFRDTVTAPAFTLDLVPGLFKAELPPHDGLGPISTLFQVPTDGPIQL